MSFLKLENNAISELASGINDAVTELTVATGEGALFPSTGDFVLVVAVAATASAGETNIEIMKCTARTTDTLTVLRAQEGTSAVAHAAGEIVALRLTKAVFEEITGDITTHKDLTTDVHGVNGIDNFGAMTPATTFYVRTTGNDANDGLTEGNAFLTVPKAVDSIAGQFSGNIVIDVGTGSFAETVTIGGKVPTGSFTITIKGALSEEEEVASAAVAAGSGATHGTVTKTGAFSGKAYANLLCYFVTDDEYRLIDSHTDDVLTLVGTAPSSTTQNIKVYSWGTTIQRANISAGQQAVRFQDIAMSHTAQNNLLSYSESQFLRCSLAGSGGRLIEFTAATLLLNTCYLGYTGSLYSLTGWANSSLDIGGCKLTSGNTGALLILLTGVFMKVSALPGNVLDGDVGGDKAAVGCRATASAGVNWYNTAGRGYTIVRNLTKGLVAARVSAQYLTSAVTFTNNTADKDAEAASYGYID